MKVDTYKIVKSNEYITVPAGTDMTTIKLPEKVQSHFKTVELFKKDFEIDPSKPLIAIDQKDIINQITNNGYAIHATDIVIEYK